VKNGLMYQILGLSLALSLLTETVVAKDKIYKRVNEDGSIEFTDQPSNDTSAVEVAPTQTFTAPATPPPTKTTIDQSTDVDTEAKPSLGYSQLKILSPSNEANITSSPGNVNVSLAIQPSLRDGDQLQLLVDNLIVGEAQASLQFNLQHLSPGAHSLHAQVIGKQGEVLHSSAPIRFYLHRPSLLRSPR